MASKIVPPHQWPPCKLVFIPALTDTCQGISEVASWPPTILSAFSIKLGKFAVKKSGIECKQFQTL